MNTKPALVVFAILLLWLIVGQYVFAFRHPMATQAQCILHMKDALLFRKITMCGSYFVGEMRGNELCTKVNHWSPEK